MNKEIVNSQLKYKPGDVINGFIFLGKDLTRKQHSRSYYWLGQCPICKKTYSTTPGSIVHGNVKSCGCLNMSKGEYAIQELLKDNQIPFETQVTFSDLRSGKKGSLRFDFGIYDFDSRLKCLVEYDGIQHYVPREYFGGDDGYITLHQNDSMKNEYCQSMGIPLIRIPYTQQQITLEMLDPIRSPFRI